ncbi:MAG: metal-sensitive transcriptional regulator [Burkholderiaceae bacterium]
MPASADELPAEAGDPAALRRDLVLRLKRVEGQVRGVQGMIERNADCEDIAQQLAAARKALDRAFFQLMACAIEHSGMSGLAGETDADRVHRITRALAKLA